MEANWNALRPPPQSTVRGILETYIFHNLFIMGTAQHKHKATELSFFQDKAFQFLHTPK